MKGKALPQHVIERMSKEDREKIGVFTLEERATKLETESERDIQKLVEQYLVQLGYERRTPEDIKRGEPRSGWFVHLHKTKRNPILLDLLVLANSTPREYLELELKTPTGKLSPEQAPLVAQGASVAYNAPDAIEIIKEWHDSL